MRWRCREGIPRHQLERKPIVSDPGMHHGTCMTHVPWCMSGLLTRCAGENVLGIPGRCATLNFTHLARGPNEQMSRKAGRWRVLSVSDGYHFRFVMFRLLLWECFETLRCHEWRGNAFRTTGPLWCLTADNRWVPFQKCQQCGGLIFNATLARTICWTNNRVAADLRRHDVHMISL